jgi:hypothetical protein
LYCERAGRRYTIKLDKKAVTSCIRPIFMLVVHTEDEEREHGS